MSKLRANIKWSHRQESNSTKLPQPSFQTNIQQETTDKNDEPSNEIEPESEARHESRSEEIENEANTATEGFNEEKTVESSSLEEETIELSSLEEFSQFLDVWVVISAEETEELTGIDDEDNEMAFLSVGDIIHPAIDPNAKWNIITLFSKLLLP
ncbi:hypothetical protein F8M41_011341 [Gigaspora margarita]|uniref:Uncharacterized protein n=1 Tax=Gigaspora margarita TaxID=4874 RepID=A0A8H4ATX2_GIGMA|nr:hypothetical protein F8M41_011341 [Gigaspora margarita]